MGKKDEAINLLTTYFKIIYEKVGLSFDQDADNEISDIIELIFEGCEEQTKRIINKSMRGVSDNE